uniref:Uncharacterized protein MANES_06G071500 n=1 Tax=Rhizophora mucronata TaxID=61149 RepID=A0A2P2KCY0_RHIMU
MVQMNYAEKLQRCREYVEALEEERRKIQVFQRELPLCLELVTQAIEACRREILSGTTTTTTTAMEYLHVQSESSEQTSSEGPVLAEFIPVKKRASSSCSDDDDNNDDENGGEQQLQKRLKASNGGNNVKAENNSDLKKKSDWLSSVQLWNQPPDPAPKENVPRKAVVTEVKRNGGAFQPFHRQKIVGKSNFNNQTIANVPPSVPASATSSTVETAVGQPSIGGTGTKEVKEGQHPQRKQRRSWSPELHRRFLNALQQLGGSHAATPKQIRELMKVDGLTNDEVKSHLQKYRLHTRRPSPAIHNDGKPEASQFFVVGGIWVPPPEYAAVVATTAAGETATITATTAGIYAPVAAAAPLTAPQATMSSVQKLQPAQSEDRQSEGSGSHSEGGSHSNSPSTSFSTHSTC